MQLIEKNWDEIDFDYRSLKATFKNRNDKILKGKKCILLISVGKKYHEGVRLAATVDLINEWGFDSCLVAVNDTLQRYNYFDKTSQDAYQYSLKMGDDWLDRNEKHINNLSSKVSIIRWNQSLQDEAYASIKSLIEKEYSGNEIYQNAIDSTAKIFIERLEQRDSKINLDLALTNSIQYLIEECPIIMPIWAKQGYDFIIYPKPMTRAMSMTHQIFVKPFYPDKVHWLSLKFQFKF